MLATELLPTIQILPYTEKLRLLQLLVSEICNEERVNQLEMQASYPIWTPFNVPPETVTKLAELLEHDQDED